MKAAVEEPLRTDDNRDVYPGLHLKAAALLLAIMREGPFHRGNGRMALLATAVFLNLNGEELNAEEGDLVALVALGSDGDLTILQVAAMLERLGEPIAPEEPVELALADDPTPGPTQEPTSAPDKKHSKKKSGKKSRD